ncbi:adenosylmethionine decarboxylase [Kallotenue papyrolyticum]|uniref:adenosylmethionine decarboxylase n=1 Tax=Kallotenue papyrolyticum TaxID=1325125 RepID=UPI0004B64FF2|nr:adenosylmethionine decarboxylase [Kallotenue papyrolyticum]
MTERAIEAPIVLGKHLIAELWGASPDAFNDPDLIRESLVAAAERGNFTILDVHVHTFSPHGVTGVLVLAESHISIHTWPEYNYAALDVFTCAGDPWAALEELKARLHVARVEVRELDRGLLRTLAPGATVPAGHRAHSV